MGIARADIVGTELTAGAFGPDVNYARLLLLGTRLLLTSP
ncbi:hypothetical protein BN1012_Phect415 [Candidatus Phaeomarinobacter ectocarpi]|uniref:Uncharacterized protein n=1 Tax=Candidatus Phaeomarinibacter ectocarpi TaxID=1458461 RepID=X5MDN3_9HYPH|nr:hypothetical protein BN1012_Phect415 [Candidatus Phaeomarinobacter ectocarpi]